MKAYKKTIPATKVAELDKAARAKAEKKNRFSKRAFMTVGYVLAGTALCGFSAAQTMALGPVTANAADDNVQTKTQSDANVNSSLAYENAAKASSKDETVYVFSKSDGSVKNITVSDKLANKDGSKTLRDQSTLTDIENVEGDGEHNKTIEGVTWDAQGKDVYYQGKTSKKPPVSMKVSYKLDGKDISADDLKGKSGKVTIRFDYDNSSASGKSGFTPFLCMTGLVLDNDQFSNVKVDNGKAIDDGDRTMVGGFAMPGLSDHLSLPSDSDIDIPEYFQVTAEVENFSMDSTFTVVTSDFFNDIDKGSIDTGKIDDALNQLQDGMTLLVDGGNKLSAGIDKLQVGSNKLQDGASQLNKGISKAYDGSQQLAAGSNQLAQSLELFKNGNDQQTGLKDALDGVRQLKAAYDSQLKDPVNKAAKQIAELKAGVGDVQFNDQTAAEFKARVKMLKNSIAQSKQIMGEVSTDLQEIEGLESSMPSNSMELLGTLDKAAGDVVSGNDKAKMALQDVYNVLSKDPERQQQMMEIMGVQKALEGSSAFATQVSGFTGKLTAAINSVSSVIKDAKSIDIDKILQDMDEASALMTKDQKAVEKLYVMLDQLDKQLDQMDTATMNKKLKEIDAQFQSAIAGVNEVSDTLGLLAEGGTAPDGRTSGGLSGAVTALGDAQTEGTLIGGATTLSNGMSTLSSGLKEANDGSAQLANGTKALTKGTASAAKGAKALKEGLVKYNNEGIKKLVDTYNKDFAGLTSSFDSILQAGKDYNNFTGITDGTEGHVKFIFETDSIDSDK